MAPERRFFFRRPAGKETLASKQQKRVWWVRIGEAAGIGALFLINFWLLWPFFDQAGEMNVFSAPVIPIFASALERWVPFPYGVRICLLVSLIFSPLSFYYFVREISGRKLAAFFSSLMVILPIGVFLPVRTNLGFLTEDGGYIASLTPSLVVCLLLLKFLRRGHFWTGILTALGATFTALTSPVGLMVLAIFMGVITFSEMLLGQGRLKVIRFLAVLTLTMGFAAFWYNPGFAVLILQSSQGQLIRRTLLNLLPISFFLVPILGVFGFLLFENRPRLQSMFIAFFLTVAFGLFSLGAGIAYPVPSRFLPAFGISLALLAGVLAVWLFDFLRTSPRIERVKTLASRRRVIAPGLISLSFVLMILITVFLGRGWQAEQSPALGLTSEQKGGIWEIKEETPWAGKVFGYAITGLTVLGAVFLRRKMGSEE